MVEVVQIRIRVPPGSFNQWQRLCADRDDEASPDEPVDSNVSSASSTQCSSSTIHANAPTPSPSDSPTTPRRTTQMSPVNIKASWDDKFNELVAFKTKFGHFNVKNKQLGSWVNRVRDSSVHHCGFCFVTTCDVWPQPCLLFISHIISYCNSNVNSTNIVRRETHPKLVTWEWNNLKILAFIGQQQTKQMNNLPPQEKRNQAKCRGKRDSMS